ncbi:MAG TPA: hypothetical protein VFI90_09980 [Rubrobacter sp.]|nr:hypothetical protein [Rubrobacter sp.]
MDTFVRDNKVLPPVLALLALFVFAWILAGAYIDSTGQEPVAHRADLAQSNGAPGPEPAPEIENRDVDSYAAYRSKDPFRQLIAPPETTSEQTTPETTEQTAPEDTSGTGTTPGTPPGNGGSAARSVDSDNDGLPDRRERALGLDPRNPDSDNDGTPDGADDANGDGRPDGGAGNAAGGRQPGGRQPGAGGGSGGGRGVRPGRGDLLDSGGTLSPP